MSIVHPVDLREVNDRIVGERIDQRIDQRIGERIDQRIGERIDQRIGESSGGDGSAAHRPDCSGKENSPTHGTLKRWLRHRPVNLTRALYGT